MAPSPPRATVFRLAAPGSVPVAVGGRVPVPVVVWVAFPGTVVAGASVVEAIDVSAVVAAVVVSAGGAVVEASVSVEAASEVEAGAEEEAAPVSTTPGGMLRVTPAEAQRAEAASMVPWS